MNNLNANTYSTPQIMGILNINSDSFYPENRVLNIDAFKTLVHDMAEKEVDILDLGAMSSRPGSTQISSQEEMDRINPAIDFIKTNYPHIKISIDTFRASVCKAALESGANIINDISGASWESDILSIVAQHKASIVLMHLLGNFENMHQLTVQGDIVEEVKKDLAQKIEKAEAQGVQNIIIDPGFGFSKTLEQNWELLTNLKALKELKKDILVGISRKRMIYEALDTSANDSLIGSSVANLIACQNGASILRVHDVRAAKHTIKIFQCSINSFPKTKY